MGMRGLGGGDHIFIRCVAKPGDIVADGAGEQRDVLRQVADGRPELPLVPGRQSGASSRTTPASGSNAPANSRATVDLPVALGPTMVRTAPAWMRIEIPRAAGRSAPAGVQLALCISTSPLGSGSRTGAGLSPSSFVRSRMRFSASFAAKMGRQAPMMASAGASARPNNRDPAKIAPPLSSSCAASQAPRPRIGDWKNKHAHLPAAPSTTARMLALFWAASISPRKDRQRSVNVAPMPIVRAQTA
jgi:hypothetical protein